MGPRTLARKPTERKPAERKPADRVSRCDALTMQRAASVKNEARERSVVEKLTYMVIFSTMIHPIRAVDALEAALPGPDL